MGTKRDCKGCRFFQAFPKNRTGECRRNPPVITLATCMPPEGMRTVACWPAVMDDQWCGAHESKLHIALEPEDAEPR